MITQSDFGVRFLEQGKGEFDWKENVFPDHIDFVADLFDVITITVQTKRNRKMTRLSIHQKHSNEIGDVFRANVDAVMPWVDSQLCEIETTAIKEQLGFRSSKIVQDSEFVFNSFKYSLHVCDGLVFAVEPIESNLQRTKPGRRHRTT